MEAKEKIKKAILYIFNNEYNCVSVDNGVLVMTHKIDFVWFKNDLKQRYNINIQEVDTTEINTVNKQPFKIIYNEQQKKVRNRFGKGIRFLNRCGILRLYNRVYG